MNVKTLCGAGEHPRRGPLPRPEPDRRERTFILPRQLPEEAAMPLGIDFAPENFHPGNPRGGEFVAFADDLPGFHADRAEPVGERGGRVIALGERVLCVGIEAVPAIGHGGCL